MRAPALQRRRTCERARRLAAAAAPADGAIAAERAFAEADQTQGQWTAFRAFAAENTVMFTPRECNVHDLFEGLGDPISAVMCWPARSFVSCDGPTVANTGSWDMIAPGNAWLFVNRARRSELVSMVEQPAPRTIFLALPNGGEIANRSAGDLSVGTPAIA